ncbi:MAG: IS21 family transposase [Deltaproteobacteria bacterium]|nr:IS21 family transposase [Deltaproteobacteria bacterium]
MSNRLKMVQKELLFALFSLNWSTRKINKALEIHRRTISRYRKDWEENEKQKFKLVEHKSISSPSRKPGKNTFQNAPPDENEVPTDGVVHFQVPTDPNPAQSKSKAAAYIDIIKQKLKKGQNARSIYQDLVIENDYTGSYDSVKRFVKKLKQNTPQLFARIEMPPGEEAQVDFGEGAPTLKNGRYYKPWLFVMTLSNSRKSYEQVVWKQDVETFLSCHADAFEAFGGVPKTIKLDNLKSGVLKAHLYEPELNLNYLAFSKHYDFVPLPCKVATPQHKGKVESGVKYTQNNALKGKRFNSLEEQNLYLRRWNKTWASTRIHGTTKRQVEMMFLEERPTLQSLPKRRFEIFKTGTRKVNVLDSHIEVAGAFYPVHPKYMGKSVTVHFNSKIVKVYYNQELVQQLSTVDKGRFHPDKSCLPDHKSWTQQQYVARLMKQCGELGSSVLEWAKEAEKVRKQAAYRAIQGVVALGKKYDSIVLDQACRKSLQKDVYNYHIVKHTIERILIEKKIQKEFKFVQEDDIIRNPQEYEKLFKGENRWTH